MPPHKGSPTQIRDRKARLTTFLNDILRVGSVQGFKYFHLYMRGREELMATVMNKPTVSIGY